MTMQATLGAGQNKTEVVFSAAVFAPPAADEVSILVNLTAADYYRELDLENCIRQLLQAAIESGPTSEDLAAPAYFSMKIAEGKGQIAYSANIASVASGDVGLALGADISFTSSGPLRSQVKYIKQAMRENQRQFV